MKNLVSQHVIDHRTDLHDRFLTAQPFRQIAIDDFLDDTFARSLLDDFPAFDEKLAVNENGEVRCQMYH